MKPPVFVGYAAADGDVARAVCEAIKHRGISVGSEPSDVRPGQRHDERTFDAIDSSKVFVLIFSTHSNKSGRVLREIERAASKGVRIITFRTEDTMPTGALEYFLNRQHWIDAIEAPLDEKVRELGDVVADTLATVERIDRRYRRIGVVSVLDHINRRFVTAAAIGVPVVAAAGLGWEVLFRPEPLDAGDTEAVAVLPFKNLTNERSLDYLSLSMPVELDALLTKSPAIKVLPVEAFQNAKAQNLSIDDLLKKYGTEMVVSGMYWTEAEKLKVRASIIDSRKEQELHSWDLTTEISKLTDVVESLFAKIGEVLEIHATAATTRASIGTRDNRAYELYMRALDSMQEITDENNESAIDCLKQAIALDARFARAYAALAESYVTRFWWNFSSDRGLITLAIASAQQAMVLSPDLAQSHNALGRAYEALGRKGDAFREYFRAVKADPRYPQALNNLARYYLFMAEFDRAIETFDRVASADPTINVHAHKAMCYFFRGDVEGSRRENHEAERSERGVDQLTYVAFIYVWLKDLDSAERVLARLTQEQPSAFSISEIRAWLSAARGNVSEARAQMATIEQRASIDFGLQAELGTFYALLGDREEAIVWLTKGVHNGAPYYAWYKSDFFKSVRGDARYDALMNGLAQEYQIARRSVGLQ